MGAWIMIHVALAIKENETRQRVVGLMGIAAAPDFTQDLLPNYLGTKAMNKIYKEGVYQMSSDYSDEPYIITKELIQDGNQMSVLKSGININLPVRLIHGTSDKEVPWDQSRKLMQALISEDVELILVKGGNHRLSNKDELQRIFITLDSLINSLELEDSIFEN
jgi:esterase/lipase